MVKDYVVELEEGWKSTSIGAETRWRITSGQEETLAIQVFFSIPYLEGGGSLGGLALKLGNLRGMAARVVELWLKGSPQVKKLAEASAGRGVIRLCFRGDHVKTERQWFPMTGGLPDCINDYSKFSVEAKEAG